MNTYIVKSGQNIFDVAITLFGSIEGVLDLLISNADIEGQAPLSYDTPLSPGDVLYYNPEFLINNVVKSYFEDNSIKVANGEHLFSHTNVKDKILEYVNEHNQKVLEYVKEMYPNIWDFSNDKILDEYDDSNIDGFFHFISDNYWGCGFTNIEYAANKYILGEDIEKSSSDENNIFKSGLVKTKMLIIQSGQLTSFTCKLLKHTILGIDWGDASKFEIYSDDDGVEKLFEHYYEDEGQHKILLYGNFVFEDLDFTNINGVYYPISVINVKGGFKSKFDTDNIINQLITINNNE